jgi:hypothetical protein
MKPVLLAFALCLVTAPAATATGGYDMRGGCSFSASASSATGATSFSGTLQLNATTTSSGPPSTPAPARVDCSLLVNGLEQNASNHLTVSGSGSEAGSQPTSYTAYWGDAVQLCATVAYASGPTDTTCTSSTTVQSPPQATIDAYDAGCAASPIPCAPLVVTVNQSATAP